MSCNTIQSKLSAYLDGEMSGVEMQSTRSHVNKCKDCQIALDEMKSVHMILRGLPASPEPSSHLPDRILNNLQDSKRNYVRLGLALAIPVIAFTILSYPRPGQNKTQDRDQVIKREMSRDQILDAGTDSTSGASLVHFTNYEGH
jgi:predicted anti-sigma-YlaC factor YlaD